MRHAPEALGNGRFGQKHFDMGAVMVKRGRATFVLVLLMSTLVAVPGGTFRASDARAQTQSPPNFVFVLTDDQRWDTVGRCTGGFDKDDLHAGTDSCMPQLQQLLMRNGTTFKRGYVTTSVCCPSRASILTGQYARHTRVVDNGGYRLFDESSTLATWLDAAGYRTANFGKYMNGYGGLGTPPLHVPPGWDTWRALWDGNSNVGYHNFTLIEKTDGGAPVLNTYTSPSTSHEPCAAGNFYSTDLWCHQALQFMRADTTNPFFLLFSATSPHLPANTARRHNNYYNDLPIDMYPSFNAAPSPNPPSWMSTEPLASGTLAMWQREHRNMLSVNLAVDDTIGYLYRELEADGRLDNTVFIFMSDNGFARGEHRYDNKGCAYEECHLVPFVISCPTGVCPGAQADTVDETNFVTNIDLAPTIAELAGATPTLVPDGSSLVPLLNGDSSGWRNEFLLEDQGTWGLNQPLGILHRAADGHIYKYVKYLRVATDFELYDLTTDPWELTNLSGDGVHTEIENHLAGRVDSMFTAPEITVTSGPNGTIPSNSATYTWTSDEPAEFFCSIDSEDLEPCGSGTSGSVTYEGVSLMFHIVRIAGTDGDNNSSVPVRRGFWAARDTTPPPAPTFTVTPPNPGPTDGAFEFTAEAGATLSCSLDGAAATTCTSPFTFTGLEGGDHSLSVTAADAAGNTSAPATYAWSVEVGVPDPPTITERPGTVSSTETTFAFEHANNVRFECSLDAAVFADCTSPTTYTGLSEGPHDFAVVAVSAGGRSDPTTASWQVVDTTAPVPPTFIDTPGDVSGVDVTFDFGHDEPGVTFTCSLDDAAFTPCESPVSHTVAGGPHTFSVVATDAAGNASLPATHGWDVDTTPPDAPTFTSTPGPTSDASVGFSFTSEPDASFECALDGSEFAGCVSPKNYTALSLSDHVFEVRAIDAVGNTGPSALHAWTVEDLTPVAPPVITVFPTDPSRGSATFEFRHDAPGTTFRCALDAGSLADCSSPATFTDLAEGQRTFSVVAVDGTGRVSDPATFTWTVDVTAPAAPSLTFTSLAANDSSVRLDFGSDDAGATFECRLDAAAFAPCTSPREYSGLTGGSHTFEVVAIDAAGNTSDAAQRTWVVTTGDSTPPEVTINGNADALVPQTRTGAAWSGSDDAGIVRYELFRRTGTEGIQEQMALSSPTATNFIFDGDVGATYCFEVLAYDAAGNVGSSGERCRAVPYDDRSAPVVYTAGVTQQSAAGAFESTLTQLTTAGHEATFSFTGRRFGIMARQTPASGIAELRLDGDFVRNIDFYAANQRDRSYVWQQPVPEGAHTITLRWTGTRNAASTGTALHLDGIGAITQGAALAATVQRA
ncbi:MAG: sulfatase-like hydrolase/transferase [Actinomycetota bacterium]